MNIQKLELEASPDAFEVVSARKTNYRSGKRFEVRVRFYWGITPVDEKFQCYTDVVTLLYDSLSETIPNLMGKGLVARNALMTADKSEADLIFELLHLAL